MAGTTHRATQENGPSVVYGKLMWTSASGITTADPQSYGGCLRRWWYEKVDGRESPETEAMRGGTALHSDIEHHLKTGESLKLPLALAGRIFVPTPGDNLLIEKPIHFVARNGVHIFGHVDLYNLRQNYIDEEGVLQADPAWSMEVKDWKTTSSWAYTKSREELADNIQLNTYSEAGFRMWPDLEWSRHTHVYFLTKGRPQSKLVTIRRSRDEVAARWSYAESVIDTMAAVAGEKNAERVPGIAKACNAYRGCPHRGYCSVAQTNSLDSLYSKIAGDIVADNQQRNSSMGLLSSNPQILQVSPEDQRAQLLAEEARMRQQVAAAQSDNAQLLAACQRILQANSGFPALTGNAAQAYAKAGGQSVAPGFAYPGQMAPPGSKRSLHALPLSEVAHIFQLADELDAERAGSAPQTPPFPSGNPTPAEPPVAAPVAPIGNTAAPAVAILPPDAPVSQPALAAVAPKSDTPPVEEKPAEAKRRGRPPKAKTEDQLIASAEKGLLPAPAEAPHEAADEPHEAHVPTGAGFCVLVNARAETPTKSLAGYVDFINKELATRYCVDSAGKPTLQDVRCAPKDSPLAFGGWPGAVRALVKAMPPPAGAYHLDTFNDGLNEAVADGLRVVVAEAGGLYVRGVR